MRITLAQIEPVTGDLEGNCARILEVIRTHDSHSDVIVFPEMAVTGYNCGSDFESEEFIREATDLLLNTIIPAALNSHIIVGCPLKGHPGNERNGAIRLHNSAVVAHRGRVQGIYNKFYLANDSHHEDRKYFLPGDGQFVTFETDGELCGVLICEDIWAEDHDRDLIAEMKRVHPALSTVFVINYSYFTYEKQPYRLKLLERHAREKDTHIVYVNAVGIGDIVKNIICYDGGSWAFSRTGKVIARLPEFHEAVTTITIPAEEAPTNEPHGCRDFDGKCSRLWGAICFTVRRMYDLMGIERAQVHVSGGLDSAIVAVAAVEALGGERTVLITNPSQYNGEELLDTGRRLAAALNVPMHSVPISAFSSAVLDDMDADAVRSGAATLPSQIGMVKSTVDAVGRTMIGLAECHFNHAAVLATGNHTENVLGWANFHDIGSIGLFQPIGDLTKTELFELAAWINRKYDREIIPTELYDGTIKPAAELADAREDPFDYYLVSGICAEIIRHRKTRKQLYTDWQMRKLTEDYFPGDDVYAYDEAIWRDTVDMCWKRSRSASVYKSAQAAPILMLSPRSRGFSSRETIITRYKG